MLRHEIINLLIKKNGYKSYLEIGVRNPDDCFNRINCEIKHGVDPGVEGDFPVTFRMTSDDFFNINESKYDIIFIDGLHIDYQVEIDIINSLKWLNDSGSILLHDCFPPTEYHARENYYDMNSPAGRDWNGSVWKAVVKIRSEIDGIFTSVVDSDWGVGIIQKREIGNRIKNNNPYFSYNEFFKNKEQYLNLITPSQFVNQYITQIEENNTEINNSSLYTIALELLERKLSNLEVRAELNQNILTNENYKLNKILIEKNQEIKKQQEIINNKNQEIERKNHIISIHEKISFFKFIKKKFFK